jgi:membrane-associated phospholipid phosphatase
MQSQSGALVGLRPDSAAIDRFGGAGIRPEDAGVVPSDDINAYQSAAASALPAEGAASPVCFDSATARPPWHKIVGRDVAAFWRAGLHLGSAPARWEWRDVAHAGCVIGLTGIEGPTADAIEFGVRQYGEAWVLTALAGGAYAAALIFEDDWLRETAFLAGTSLILTTTVTRILKITVGRGRPYHTTDPHTFRMFSFADAYNSFPSGHSVAAFSVSAVLAHRLDNVWATVGLYSLATLTSLSRIYADEHWFSDVVFGALCSTAMTRTIIRWFDNEQSSPDCAGFSITPAASGIMVVYRF